MPTGIVVQCQTDRSQHRNRAMAMAMLKARLYEAELQKREAAAAALEATKTDIGWGHQIRSYVLQPYQMVKDLRTGVETSNTTGRARWRHRPISRGRTRPAHQGRCGERAAGLAPARPVNHPIAAFSTSSTCPGTLTLRQTARTTPLASMRKVARSMPMYLRPYMLFSIQVP